MLCLSAKKQTHWNLLYRKGSKKPQSELEQPLLQAGAASAGGSASGLASVYMLAFVISCSLLIRSA